MGNLSTNTINELKLSPREMVVIAHMMEGKSTKKMAEDLGLSARTIGWHLTTIYKKLSVKNRSEAILKVHGLAQKEYMDQVLDIHDVQYLI